VAWQGWAWQGGARVVSLTNGGSDVKTKSDPRWPTWRTAWQAVYDVLLDKPPGFLLSLEELERVTESTRSRAQAALRRARRQLLKDYNRWLIAIPSQGYRVVEAREHADVATGYRQAARRKLKTGLALTLRVNLDEITKPQDLARLEWTQKLLVLTTGFVDQLAKLKELPARPDLRLPSTSDLLRVVDGTRRKRAEP
jgi:hypothetical protein